MLTFIKMHSVEDVVEMLWADGPACLVMAGGTDILVRPEPFAGKKILLDISDVEELTAIGENAPGGIRVGAGCTHQEIATHALITRRARLLGLACGSVGSVQIRNRGTLGGNLGNASPAGDSIPALACLEASVEISSRDRRREMPVLELFRGPGQTDLGFDEVITAVRIPAHPGRTVAFFKKAGQRKGMCCSKASVAFCARRRGDGRLTGVRIAMGAVAPSVVRVPEAEQLLEGRAPEPGLVQQVALACSRQVRAIDDIRSSADYRRKVVGALLTHGLYEIMDHTSRIEQRRRRRRRR